MTTVISTKEQSNQSTRGPGGPGGPVFKIGPGPGAAREDVRRFSSLTIIKLPLRRTCSRQSSSRIDYTSHVEKTTDYDDITAVNFS